MSGCDCKNKSDSNDQGAAAAADGSWSLSVVLPEGVGRIAMAVQVISPPHPPPPPPPPPNAAFSTLHQPPRPPLSTTNPLSLLSSRRTLVFARGVSASTFSTGRFPQARRSCGRAVMWGGFVQWSRRTLMVRRRGRRRFQATRVRFGRWSRRTVMVGRRWRKRSPENHQEARRVRGGRGGRPRRSFRASSRSWRCVRGVRDKCSRLAE